MEEVTLNKDGIPELSTYIDSWDQDNKEQNLKKYAGARGYFVLVSEDGTEKTFDTVEEAYAYMEEQE